MSNTATRSTTHSSSLRHKIGALLLLFGMAPVFALGLLYTFGYGRITRERSRVELIASVNSVEQSLEDFFGEHQRVVQLVAQAPQLQANFTPEVLQSWLTLLHLNYPGFVTLIATDASGQLLAAEPRDNAKGEHDYWRGQSITDRVYFQEVMRSGKAYLSAVFQGRGYAQDPIIAASSPIFAESGEPLGLLEGSIDLNALARRLNQIVSQPYMSLVLDAEGKVVYASPLLELKAGELVRQAAFVAPLLTAAPLTLADISMGEKFPELLGVSTHMANRWTVIGYLSSSAISKAVMRSGTVASVVLILVLIAALLALPLALRAVGRPIARLARQTEDFSPHHEQLPDDFVAAMPRELQPVAQSFVTLVDTERRSFAELSAALEEQRALRMALDETLREREHEIKQRTAELQSAVAALRDASMTDGLTGLANYRAYREHLETTWKQTRSTVGAIALDIDYFKHYNDRYGHQGGDMCLREVGGVLQRTLSARAAVVARTGGEEFLAIFKDMGRHELLEMAENLLQSLRLRALEHVTSEYGIVTASIGVAVMVPGANLEPDALIRAADHALYRAKRNGRNRVMEFSPATLQELKRQHGE